MVVTVVLAGPALALPAETGAATAVERAPVSRDDARRIAQAATWQVDPRLLRSRPADSVATAAARERLARLSLRVRRSMAAYDGAREIALEAREAAQGARAKLRRARADLHEARLDHLARKDVLVTILTTTYVSTELAPLSVVLTSRDHAVSDLIRLEEMSHAQATAVVAAEEARVRLQRAEAVLEAAEQEATAEFATARASWAVADQRRQAVLDAARAAQAVVTTSELADLARREDVADGYHGSIAFPLAPGTAFRDLDNFGGHGQRWANQHTGDDLAAACGSGVVAATGGTVNVRTDQPWSGRWLVTVTATEGSLTTWYAHLQALDVTDGQRVRAGESLGQVGALGNATGCHLHFEVHPTGGGIYEDGIDPVAWLVELGAHPGP